MGERIGTYRWVMAGITWLMLFALGISWFCFPPLILRVIKDLTVTFEQVGIIIALVPLSLVLLCIPGGLLADRFGVRITVLAGGTIMGVFGLLRGFATDFVTLAITTFLCGVGYSIAYPNLPKVTGIWFPRGQYALVSGIMFSGMEAGTSLPFILIPALLLPWTGSWQWVFIVIGMLSLAITALWMALARETPRSGTGSLEANSRGEPKGVPFKESLSVTIRNRNMWILMLTTFFLLAPQIALLGFLPTMLVLKGIDPLTAGAVASMISFFMIPGSFIVPLVSDRFGRRKPFIWVTSLLAGGVVYFVGTAMGLSLWISAIIYGFLIGGMAPIVLAMPIELVGPSYSATAGGFMLVGGYAGALIGPWSAGYLSTTTGSFAPAAALCALLTWVDVICGLMLKETHA
jgi:MFS family permease